MVIIWVGLLSTDNYKWLRLQTTSIKQDQIGKSRRVVHACSLKGKGKVNRAPQESSLFQALSL